MYPKEKNPSRSDRYYIFLRARLRGEFQPGLKFQFGLGEVGWGAEISSRINNEFQPGRNWNNVRIN